MLVKPYNFKEIQTNKTKGKTIMMKTNNTTQTDAVKRIFTLRKNGVTVANAKAIVAEEFNTSVYKLTQWLKTHGKTVSNNTVVPRRNIIRKSDYSFNDMSNDIRGVLKSVVNQDGRYTTREAGVIGKLYGAELTRAKLLLEVHKHNTKVSSNTADSNTLNII